MKNVGSAMFTFNLRGMEIQGDVQHKGNLSTAEK